MVTADQPAPEDHSGSKRWKPGGGELPRFESTPATQPYPAELEIRARIEDHVSLLIRPAKPADEQRLRRFFDELGSEQIHWRSRVIRKYLPLASVRHLCIIDYNTRMTLVASILAFEVEKLIGCALYALDVPTGFAECTLAVAHGYRRCGFGTRLIRQLVRIAEMRGIRGFSAVAPYAADPLVRAFRKCGYPIEWTKEHDLLFLRIPFECSPRHLHALPN
jgi:acetyltransferase